MFSTKKFFQTGMAVSLAVVTGFAGSQLQAAPISGADILANWTQSTGFRSNGGPNGV